MSDLDHVLSLAKAAFVARDSTLWRTNIEAASEVYGDACEAVWAELERLVQAGNVRPAVTRASIQKTVAKATLEHIQRRLPDIVSDLLNEVPLD